MDIIDLKPAFSDDRGHIIDLIDNEEINAVTIVTFTKGAVRANHYHKHTIQWNYVMRGEILLATQYPGQDKVERVLKAGDFVITPANERHALKGLSDAEVLILTKGPRAGLQYESDTFRLDVLLIDPNA